MGRIERQRELARRRSRKVKIQKLRTRFAAAKTDADKAAISDKLFRVSPFAPLTLEPAAQ